MSSEQRSSDTELASEVIIPRGPVSRVRTESQMLEMENADLKRRIHEMEEQIKRMSVENYQKSVAGQIAAITKNQNF
jgi:hypothetical protein